MCNLSEGIADRAELRGEKRGEKRGKREMILNLWQKGMQLSFIQEVSGWTEQQIMAVLPKNKKTSPAT
jgi:hypothetical protein